MSDSVVEIETANEDEVRATILSGGAVDLQVNGYGHVSGVGLAELSREQAKQLGEFLLKAAEA